MFDAICLSLALTVGQPPLGMKAMPPAAKTERNTDGNSQPFNVPIVVLASHDAPAPKPEGVWLASQKDATPPADAKDPAPADKKDAEEKKNGEEEKKNGEEEKKEEPKKGYFMQMIEGTELGCHLQQKGITVSGWFELGYACSNADGKSNLPVTWDERNRKLRTHQFWVRVQQPLDTESKCPSTGFLVDVFWGSDYRYTLQRGFFNSQLQNTRGGQNNHGFDMPQAFVNYYDPGLFEGTELRLGKFFCPFGYESIEGPSTPLLSRSYTFNWGSPFTHWGGMALANLDKNQQVMACVVNGNDVMWFDPAEEYRFVAKYQWTSDDKKTFWALATSFGRGRFDPSEPFAPATFAAANEPAGRNNINVFDFVYSTAVSDELTLACEALYGYQYNVPANVSGGIIDLGKAPGQPGTAHWAGLVGYSFYKFDDKVTGVLRGEMFYDAEGQRTGFEGLYCAGTVGLQIRPTDCLLIRPELRYDRNDYSRPFDGGRRHDLCTAAFDVILLY